MGPLSKSRPQTTPMGIIQRNSWAGNKTIVRDNITTTFEERKP